MLRQLLLKPCLIDFRIMLSGNQHRIETNRNIILIVFDGHLGLAIRTQVRHLAILAHLRKTICQTMRQVNRQWHQRVGLIACIAEHHTLIAGTLCFVALLARCLRFRLTTQTSHTLIDFGTLLGQ